MSIRRDGSSRRATLTARVATACAAVAALVACTAPAASAYVPCPTHDIPAVPTFHRFDTLWPTSGADPKGVTICLMKGSWEDQGYLQIADLNDGAKLRLVSQVDPSSPTPDRLEPYTRYTKRTAEEWYSHIRGGYISSPASSRLFSTTNASFFDDSDNSNPTTLPFPHRFNQTHETWGTIMGDLWRNFPPTGVGCPNNPPPDPDVCAPKRAMHIGDPNAGGAQTVGFMDLPVWGGPIMLYDSAQAYGYLRNSGYAYDGTMSFWPTYEVGSPNRRNYVGVYNNKVYIFTSIANYTSSQANDIMQQIQPGMTVLQLDGGGSAQFHSDYAELESNVPFPKRQVPDVLAIYRAP